MSEQIVVDLLRIAKVAMPGKLYTEDARLVRAQAWLETTAAEGEATLREIEDLVNERSNRVARVPNSGMR